MAEFCCAERCAASLRGAEVQEPALCADPQALESIANTFALSVFYSSDGSHPPSPSSVRGMVGFSPTVDVLLEDFGSATSAGEVVQERGNRVVQICSQAQQVVLSAHPPEIDADDLHTKNEGSRVSIDSTEHSTDVSADAGRVGGKSWTQLVINMWRSPSETRSTYRFTRARTESAASTNTSAPRVLGTALGRAMVATTSANVRNLVTFAGHEGLLRGTQLSSVMRVGCSIMASSSGSASTYQLSDQVKQLDTFISHNWSVQRYKKFLALCLHFNIPIAAVTTCIAMVIFGVLSTLGYFPTFPVARSRHPEGICCRLVCVPIFILSILFCRDVLHLVRIRGPVVFLDKTCIHQEDESIQRMGIEKLAAFMGKSDRLLILYTDVYLCKLWTVYEVASFLALHPLDDMKVMPTFLATVFFSNFVCIYLSTVLSVILELVLYGSPMVSSMPNNHIVTFIVCFAYMVIVRRWAKKRENLRVRLHNFSVRDCMCACESDRPKVYANIASLMRHLGLTGAQSMRSSQQLTSMQLERLRADTEEQECLDTFDLVVRSELGNVLGESFGMTALSYPHYLAWSALYCMPPVFDSFGGVPFGMTARECVVMSLRNLNWTFALIPLFIFLMESSCNWCKSLEGWREVLYLIVAYVVTFVAPGSILITAFRRMEVWADVSNLGFGLFVIAVILLCAFTAMVYSGFLCRCCCRRQSCDHEATITVERSTSSSVRVADSIQSWIVAGAGDSAPDAQGVPSSGQKHE